MNDTPTSNEQPEETVTDQVFEEGAQFDATSDPDAEPIVMDAGDPEAEPQDPLAEANDRVLRTQAELENYRRRARREMEDQARYAAMPLLRDLMPVLDNMQRAIEAAEKKPAHFWTASRWSSNNLKRSCNNTNVLSSMRTESRSTQICTKRSPNNRPTSILQEPSCWSPKRATNYAIVSCVPRRSSSRPQPQNKFTKKEI